MKLFSTDNTYAAFRLFYAFLNKVRKWTVIIINVLFTLIYAFDVYLYHQNIILLSVYSCILGFSLILTIITICLESSLIKDKDKDKIDLFSKIIVWIRYSLRLAVIIFGFVIYFCFNENNDEILITNFVTLVLFIIQIILYLTLLALKKYAKIFEVAIKKDIEESSISTLINPRKALSDKIGKMADKLSETKPQEEEDEEIIKKLELETSTFKKAKEIEAKETFTHQVDRLEVAFKSKLEKQSILREANRMLFKMKKEAEKLIKKNHEFEFILAKYISQSEDFRTQDHNVNRFIDNTSEVSKLYLSKKIIITKESLTLLVSFAAIILRYMDIIDDKKLKIIICVINQLISNEDFLKLLQ